MYRQDVIQLAAQNALKDARTLADTLGVKLVKVAAISLNQINTHTHQVPMACFAKMSNQDAMPPIEPGDVTLSATVNICWEIY
jgi:uncharacterized protein YggE